MDSPIPYASIRPGSRVVVVTGTGRVCGVSASSAPSTNTREGFAERRAEVIRPPNWRQRRLGSMPSTRIRSRPPASCAVLIRVVGQVISRSPSALSATSGRLTW